MKGLLLGIALVLLCTPPANAKRVKVVGTTPQIAASIRHEVTFVRKGRRILITIEQDGSKLDVYWYAYCKGKKRTYRVVQHRLDCDRSCLASKVKEMVAAARPRVIRLLTCRYVVGPCINPTPAKAQG